MDKKERLKMRSKRNKKKIMDILIKKVRKNNIYISNLKINAE